MGNEVTNTFDVKIMDRFDASTAIEKIKVTTTGIYFIDTKSFNVGDEYAVYVSKNGSVVLFAKEKGGYEIKATGRGGAGRFISCKPVIRELELRGVQIPQEAELLKDDDGRRYARLANA